MEVMIGTHLKELRTKRGWTQVQLAQASGIRQGELTYYEKNLRTPTAPKLAALAKALKVPMEALVSGEVLQDEAPLAEPKFHGNSTNAQIQRLLAALDPERQKALLHHAKLLALTQEAEQAAKTTSKPSRKRAA